MGAITATCEYMEKQIPTVCDSQVLGQVQILSFSFINYPVTATCIYPLDWHEAKTKAASQPLHSGCGLVPCIASRILFEKHVGCVMT